MIHKRSRWRLSFWPVLAFVCVLPLLVALGVWQTTRGLEKQQAWAEFEARRSGDAVAVDGLELHDLDALPSWQLISLRGRYLGDHHFLLDNLSQQGRPGHHVLTPFRPEGEDYVIIVDRGWRAGLAQRSRQVESTPDELVEVRGMLAPFPRPALELSGKPLGKGWPRVVQFPTADELSTALDRPVVARRLLLDPVATEGFSREWSAPGMPPARHFGYAFQWFALAAALIVIFVLMARPRRTEDEQE